MSDCCRVLDGKVAVITGAAQGLGEALAHRLDKECCKLVVTDINIEKAREVAASLTDAVAFCVCFQRLPMVNLWIYRSGYSIIKA